MYDRRVARGSNFASLRPNVVPTVNRKHFYFYNKKTKIIRYVFFHADGEIREREYIFRKNIIEI